MSTHLPKLPEPSSTPSLTALEGSGSLPPRPGVSNCCRSWRVLPPPTVLRSQTHIHCQVAAQYANYGMATQS